MATNNLDNRSTVPAKNIDEFAAARTHPYIVQVLAQACRNIEISVAGQRRLSKALNDLPYVEAVDPDLGFGWSPEHLIRSSEVNLLYEHLLVVVTLAESFHNTYCAEVLHALIKKTLPKLQNAPHIYQCLGPPAFLSGVLANDDFGLLVESYIALDPYSITLGGKYSSDECLVPPQSMADALSALAELTSGRRNQMSMRGGAIVGWVAAYAELFLGLSVKIESKRGDHLHGPHENTQLFLMYTDRPELIIDDTTMTPLTQELSNVSLAPYKRQIHFLPYGGRIPWNTLLPQVFGQSFHDLDHKHARLMFTAIGSAFCAMEAAKDSSSISVKRGSDLSLTNPPPESITLQLITTLTTYLSSLQHGQGRMERQLKLSPQKAAKIHLDSIRELCTECQCAICSEASDTSSAAHRTSEGPGRESIGYCLPSIVITIVTLALLLSRIVLVHPLNPSREGVQLLYKLQTGKIPRYANRSSPAPTPSTIADLYDNILTGPTSQILRMAVKFFGGGHLPPLGNHLLPHEVVAIAHEGMCAFASELAGGKNVRKDMRGMVRLVNGGFGLRSKSYHLAAWSVHRPGGRETWQWEEIDLQHLRGLGGKLWFK